MGLGNGGKPVRHGRGIRGMGLHGYMEVEEAMKHEMAQVILLPSKGLKADQQVESRLVLYSV